MTRPSIEYTHVTLKEMAAWPATPGLRRLLLASNCLQGQSNDHDNGEEPMSTQELEDLDWMRTFEQVTAYTIQASASFAALADTLQHPREFNRAFVSQAIAGDTAAAIGVAIWLTRTTGPDQIQSAYTFTQLLRDPEWMGLCPYLPLLKDLSVTMRESSHAPGEPGSLLAVPNMGQDTQAGETPPEGLPSRLAQIIRHHGARNCEWWPVRRTT